jgi:hypothetical protein
MKIDSLFGVSEANFRDERSTQQKFVLLLDVMTMAPASWGFWLLFDKGEREKKTRAKR